MEARSSAWTRHLLLLFFFPVLAVATLSGSSHTTTINVTNRCSYTVWPAATPVGGGVRLDPGNTWVLRVPNDAQGGRVWARTGCSFDGPGNKSCQTGDCGGVLACTTSGQPPMTMAEFTMSAFNSLDFFDITVVDGFNVPMDFLPVPGSSGCSKGPRCAADITSQCPDGLKVPGGCRGACESCNGSTEQTTRSSSVPQPILCHCLHLHLHLLQMEQVASHPHQNPREGAYLVLFSVVV